MDYARFDQRGYRTVPVGEGYGLWAETYESVVQDEMDIRLLERLSGVDWAQSGAVLDLACGTGRIGAWLRAKGAAVVDGVDFTPQMLARAQARGVYRRLSEADVTRTSLAAGGYRLIVQSLADEHLRDLAPLYAEVARLASREATFVLVGYHPHFLMNGVPTHFNAATGEPVAVESYVHLASDHVKAARAAGWRLETMEEGVIDDAWVAKKPKWERFRHHPVSFAMVWRRG
jgi:SAM-dependent methyltransferase